MNIDTEQLKKYLTNAIRRCEKAAVGLESSSHKRIDLEGKIYAYQYVKNDMLSDRYIGEGRNN